MKLSIESKIALVILVSSLLFVVLMESLVALPIGCSGLSFCISIYLHKQQEICLTNKQCKLIATKILFGLLICFLAIIPFVIFNGISILAALFVPLLGGLLSFYLSWWGLIMGKNT